MFSKSLLLEIATFKTTIQDIYLAAKKAVEDNLTVAKRSFLAILPACFNHISQSIKHISQCCGFWKMI